jgi:hypothetical protein
MSGKVEVFHVSPSGNDAWSGRLPKPNAGRTDGPFESLEAARTAVRGLRKPAEGTQAPAPSAPVTVRLHAGTWRRLEAFSLGAEDGGTESCPVTWEAEPGCRPVITGNMVVEGWTEWRNGIMRAPAPARMFYRGKPRQLFYKGRRQRRARWPKYDPTNPIAGGWIIPEGPVEGLEYLALRFPRGSFPRTWAKPWVAEANIYGGWGWCNNVIPVLDVDREVSTLRLSRAPINLDQQPWYMDVRFSEANRFYIENVLEELSEPGEWCLETEERMLYFLPPEAGFDPSAVEVPCLDRLIAVRGAEHLTLRGLTLTGTTTGDDYHPQGVQGIGANFSQQGWQYCGETLHLRGTRHCLVEGCLLDQCGGNGIYLERDNYRSAVRRCEVAHAGANGIVLAGDRPFHPLFCEVTDNDVHHAGSLINLVAGVSLGTSDGCVVAHNFLHDLPHHAVQLGANGLGRNYVEYNEIRRVCLAIHDTGAINSWMDGPGPWVEPHDERSGHVIRWNLIVDVPGCRVEKGRIVEDVTTRGIYLDDYTSNCLVYGNLVARAGMGLQFHSGKHNTVENNVIVDCRIAFWACDFPPLRSGNAHTKGSFRANRFARNVFSTSRPDAFLYWMHAWTDLTFQCIDENVIHAPRAADFRIAWESHPKGLERCGFEEWRAMGFDGRSLVADPLFVDPAREDWRLRPESPAWALGFEAIPFGRIGIRRT